MKWRHSESLDSKCTLVTQVQRFISHSVPGNETERQIPRDAQNLFLTNNVQADSNLHRRASSKSLSSKIKKMGEGAELLPGMPIPLESEIEVIGLLEGKIFRRTPT